MGLRERLANLLVPVRKAPEKPAFITGLVGPQVPNQPVYGDMTVEKATREGYKISIYVYRAVRTIVQAASGIPWLVLDKNGEEVPNHPFTMKLQWPNEAMSGQDLMELTIAHLCLPGNAIWQPLMVGGQIKELWPVMPDLVRPIPSGKPGEWLAGWEVTDSSGKRTTAPPDRFIHFMQFDPGNPYWGTGPLMAAARCIDCDNEAQDTQKISMQNRGLTDGVFKVGEEPLTEEQFAEAQRQIAEQYTAKAKRRAPWVVGGATFIPMAMNMVEMDFIASRLANKQDIAAAFGIDSAFLGDKSASTYNNVIEMKKALYENAVLPMLDDIKATLNLRVPLKEGEVITYDTSGVAALRDDYGKKVESASKLWALGVPVMQLNDLFELGLEEYDGWDISYLPMGVLPSGGGYGEESPETSNTGKARKGVNLQTEEQKAAHWRRVDVRRTAYWKVVAEKIAPLYRANRDAAIEVVQAGGDRESLPRKVAEALRARQPEWEKAMVAILTALVADFGQDAAEDLGAKPKGYTGHLEGKADWVFQTFTQATWAWIKRHAAEQCLTIVGTDVENVRAALMSEVESGATIDEIGRRLRNFYDDRSAFNAMRVARTEVGAAASAGQMEAAQQSGIVKSKQWLSSRDDRVRESHQEMDGEERPLDGTFSNGCDAPGIGGDASEVVQCRCTLTFNTR